MSPTILLLIWVLTIRPATVLIHELGHAIAALCFSRREVLISFGSYRKNYYTFEIQVGRLKTRFSFRYWMNIGTTYYENPDVMPEWQNFLITLSGMLVSFAGLVISIWASAGAAPSAKFLLLMTALSFCIDLCANGWPGTIRFDEGVLLSDGYQLRRFLVTHYKSRNWMAKELKKSRKGERSVKDVKISKSLLESSGKGEVAAADTNSHMPGGN